MTASASPPRWAQAALRAFLPARDFDSVAGDLLEEYREHRYPTIGHQAADNWYLWQVFGFAWRNAMVWAALFAIAFIARTMLDWRVPATDFHTRAMVSTMVGGTVFLLAGFWAGLRSNSFGAGPVIAATTAVLAAPMQLLGAGALLLVWNDSATMAAVRNSGGIGEAFFFPLFTFLPAIGLGAVGGGGGAAVTRLRCSIRARKDRAKQ